MASPIRNVSTNISGRAKFERMVSRRIWHDEILPLLDSVLNSKKFQAKGRIGHWIVEAVGDDPHIHEFFCLNFQKIPGNMAPQVRGWHAAHAQDPQAVRKLLGLNSETALTAHRDQFLKFLQDPRFRVCLKDPDLLNIEKFPEERQKEIALHSPAFIYCPEEHTSVSLNTTYYGQFKSKSCLGALEEFLITQKEDVWLSMHAGAVEYVTEKQERRGVVLVGPTGTAKSTHAYGLASAKKQNRMHSDDWLFIHADSGKVLAAEHSFYMRTQMAEFYPELAPVFLRQPLENVPMDQDLCKTPAARVMLDPAVIWDASKRVGEIQLTDLFLIKRDYQDPMLIQKISAEQMVEILTAAENVFQYSKQKDAQGRDILEQKAAEPYYNPYLCRAGIELDRLRLAAWRRLAGLRGLRIFQMNARLPVLEMQDTLRRFLENH